MLEFVVVDNQWGMSIDWDDPTLRLVTYQQIELRLLTDWAITVDSYSILFDRLTTTASVLAYPSIHCRQAPGACRQRPSTAPFFYCCCYLQRVKNPTILIFISSPHNYSTHTLLHLSLNLSHFYFSYILAEPNKLNSFLKKVSCRLQCK